MRHLAKRIGVAAARMRKPAARALEATLHASGVLRLFHQYCLPGHVPVLMYHGLTEARLPVPDPCFLRVETFARQMDYLARNFEIVHVHEIFSKRARQGRRPLACVTFDDGFASVAELAWPILEHYRIPATVYLVTDLVDTSDTLWFARLLQALCETTASEVSYGDHRFCLREASGRAHASARLQQALKLLGREEFASRLAEILDQLAPRGSGRSAVWPSFKMLTSRQIERISQHGLVRFGAHTASHQILTRISAEEARQEIGRSVTAVAKLVEHPSPSFAYPNGGAGDFDAVAIDALKRNGITHGLTTLPAAMVANTDPYSIPRYNIADVTDARFSSTVHHLHGAFKGYWNGVRPSPNATGAA